MTLTCPDSVSYTHLDVYKRQEFICTVSAENEMCMGIHESRHNGFARIRGFPYTCLLYTSNQTTSGSEDFAEVSRLVPSMFFAVGGGDRKHGYEFSAHHPKVRYDETSLVSGAAAFACGAKAYLAAKVK